MDQLRAVLFVRGANDGFQLALDARQGRQGLDNRQIVFRRQLRLDAHLGLHALGHPHFHASLHAPGFVGIAQGFEKTHDGAQIVFPVEGFDFLVDVLPVFFKFGKSGPVLGNMHFKAFVAVEYHIFEASGMGEPVDAHPGENPLPDGIGLGQVGVVEKIRGQAGKCQKSVDELFFLEDNVNADQVETDPFFQDKGVLPGFFGKIEFVVFDELPKAEITVRDLLFYLVGKHFMDVRAHSAPSPGCYPASKLSHGRYGGSAQDQPLRKGDQGVHDPGDDPGVKQGQQDKEAEGLQLAIDSGQLGGQKVAEHLAAVQGRDGDQVEDGQHHVDPDAGGDHLNERPEDRHGQHLGEGQEQPGGEAAGDGEQQVGGNPGQRDPDHALAWIFKIAGIHRHRLGPADLHDQKGQHPEGVEVAQGVQAEPAQLLGGWVAELVGDEAVGKFVDREGQQKRGGEDGDFLNELRDVHGRAIAPGGQNGL